MTAGTACDAVLAGHGTQPGGSARAGRAIITAVGAEHPPLHLLLGGDALDRIRQAMADLLCNMDGWEKVTRDTDLCRAEQA